MNRKFLAKVLAASLVLTATPALPGAEADAASQKTGGGYLSLVKSNRGANIKTELDFSSVGFSDAFTQGISIPLTDTGIALECHSQTAGTDGWNVPFVFAYSNTEMKAEPGAATYKEYVVIRGDGYAWSGAANTGPGLTAWNDLGYTFEIKEDAGDTWQSDITSGIDCKVQAIKSNNKIYIEFTAGKKKTLTSLPYTGEEEVYISLSGEMCNITNIAETEYTNIVPEDPTPDNPGTDEPGTDNPGTEDPKPDNPGTDTPVTPGDTENSVTFEKWWSKHLEGVKITEEGITANFKSKSNGTFRHDVPVYVVFSSDDKKVNGTNYAEYGVMRSDCVGWAGTAGKIKYWGEGSDKYYSDKDAGVAGTESEIAEWVEAKQKDFVDYTVSAYKSGKYVFMKINAGGLVTYAKVTVSSSANTYLSLSGENCSVKDITWGNTGTFESNEPEDLPTDDTVVDCPGWQTNFSKGYKVDGNGVSLTFDSKTYDVEGVANWFTPQVFVYTSDDGEVKGEGYGYLANFRSDAFVEMPEGANYSTTFRGVGDWGLWLDANKSETGVKCAVSAVREDNKVIVKFSNNGIIGFLTIPEVPADKEVYIALTGGSCKLTNITPVTFTGITVPAGIATYPVILPTPTPAPTLPPVDENATPAPTPLLEPETLTGTAWWDGSQKGRDYTLKGEGTLDLYVTFDSTTDSNGYGAFNVELLSDGNKYITTGSDDNAWVAEEGTGTVVDAANTGSTIVAGHVYKISVKRTGYDFSVVYYDLTDNKEYCSMEIKNTNQGIDVNVHIIAQVGKFIVSQAAPDVVTPPTTATPAPSTDPAATPEPGITPAPGATATPGTTPDPGTTVDPGTQTPGTTDTPEEPSKEDNKKKTMKVSDITAKTGKKKVTGNLSVKGTKVQVKVGNKKYKNAKVNGKKFTFTVSSKLKKGTKITIKVTKSGYKTVTKTVKVK
ncbi:MAG: hypothetical protein HFH66_12035 [Lachnospiraceae bacterium]|nr:hypothetical protein [Lachnospiraceae bacterium]